MRCPIESQDDAVLLDYCAGTLEPAAAAVLERHIAICAACGRFQSEQQAVWNALDEWQPARVSADFDRRLYRRINAETSGSWWSRLAARGSVFWKPAVPVAALCLTLLAVALFRTPAELPAPAQESGQVRIETVQVDQMERTLEDLEMLSQFDLVTAANRSNTGSL